MDALKIENLQKCYGTFCALDNVNLTIPEGEFFGLLGPNGAGKTTLINTVMGLVCRNSGAIRVFGKDNLDEPALTRSYIGLSPQEANVDQFFRVNKILYFNAGYHGIKRRTIRERIDEVLEKFGLTEKRNAEFWQLSGGMQKRVMIARALITKPRLLILDEPTAGVDVEQRHMLWDVLRTLKRDGTTIILTTHYIDEAEELCERVGIIQRGNVVEIGSPQELIKKHCDQHIMIKGQRFDTLTSKSVSQLINGGNIDPSDISVVRGDLEKVFIKLTGHKISGDENA